MTTTSKKKKNHQAKLCSDKAKPYQRLGKTVGENSPWNVYKKILRVGMNSYAMHIFLFLTKQEIRSKEMTVTLGKVYGFF